MDNIINNIDESTISKIRSTIKNFDDLFEEFEAEASLTYPNPPSSLSDGSAESTVGFSPDHYRNPDSQNDSTMISQAAAFSPGTGKQSNRSEIIAGLCCTSTILSRKDNIKEGRQTPLTTQITNYTDSAAHVRLGDNNGPLNGFTLNSASSTDRLYSSTNSSPSQSASYSSQSSNDHSPSITQSDECLRILVQPKAKYRDRYWSETDETKNRAQRFIRADGDDETKQHEYPTIEIPPKWCDPNRNLYIRVTLVTVPSDRAPKVCIHPYAIDSKENGVRHGSHDNSLYFPITTEEKHRGQKSFRMSRKKKTQPELKSYGPLRLYDSNQHDIPRISNVHDAKQIIKVYELWKSQLIFTVAELACSNQLLNPEYYTSVMYSTSVKSQVMCDVASRQERLPSVNDSIFTTILDNEIVRCVPRKGDWDGGDEILMTIPKIDRHKGFNVYFDYHSNGIVDIQVTFVDSKTIFFQTPPCKNPEFRENSIVPLIVIQGDFILARIDFVYKKRRCSLADGMDTDGVESLISPMTRLTTEEKPIKSNHQSNNEGKGSEFDKYLGQLQVAAVEFLRTNDPSKIFRRTRLLIGKCTENPPPLHDAIQHNHINLALKLIEQTVDMPSSSNNLLEREDNDGVSPLLFAAKFNQWTLIEAILKKRLDLIEKTDKSDNNILHLLANISEDKATETIKNIFVLLSNDTKTKLLEKKNNNNETPMEIAQANNNNLCVDLFKTS
ncbi:unnamed protein product [Adineta steineri]|uniref:Uncharacterized protein n=2 Tax=Adineta steineri TaxID=433720 RepID=A0A814IER1_9BILA|nr:unnamed protein product [Adineta steineri]CAF1129742.1 unnamed protein product [Adineta steineri]